MIKKVMIENYRCFAKYEISLTPTTIIVGRNNAGKSTFIEAMRLLSLVANRYKNLTYKSPPTSLDIPRYLRGVSPSIEAMDLNFTSIFYRYGEPPAKVTITFDSEATIDIYIGEEKKVFAVIKDDKGKNISSKNDALKLELPEINILPQIGPLLIEEELLDDEYVQKHILTSRGTLHFRNQLRYLNQFFPMFKRLAEQTWQGLRIENYDHKTPSLLIQDGRFVAEVGWMGHGLQMWLQTMWFLSRASEKSVVILDEPDVYMHADLQRRLVRLLKRRYRQIIVATHSIEIMSEVEPGEIAVLDKHRTHAVQANSLPGVQNIVESIGSAHNIHLARLWSSKRCLLVEGKDLSFLKVIYDIIFPDSEEALDTIPNFAIGGWSGWNYAVGTSMIAKEGIGNDVMIYCILDSDYHRDSEKHERLDEAKRRGIQLHIWEYKEIENYFIIPAVIQRIIASECPQHMVPPTVHKVREVIEKMMDAHQDRTLDNISNEIHLKNKDKGIQFANAEARSIVNSAWVSWDRKLSIISGKQLISDISGWVQKEYGVTISFKRICKHCSKKEVHREIVDVVTAISNCRTLN